MMVGGVVERPCCYAKLDEVISKAKGGQRPTSCLTLCVNNFVPFAFNPLLVS